MAEISPRLLVADDEPFALSFIFTLLKNENYRITAACDGVEAWNLLESSPEDYDAVILDRKMPGLDGMGVLARIKTHEVLKMVPVIFQTSMDDERDILEGFKAGVDYYLTKPYNKDILLAVVKTAVSSYAVYKSLLLDVRQTLHALRLMTKGSFEFRTMEEARMLAGLLADISPNPDKTAIGLWELMFNSLEHGNLGITFKEKSRLIEKDTWYLEILRRMALPENAAKKVFVEFEHSEKELRFLIRDQGRGFDWESFMELNPERAFEPNGRGIYMARTLSFDRLEYPGAGNEVSAVIVLKKGQRSEVRGSGWKANFPEPLTSDPESSHEYHLKHPAFRRSSRKPDAGN